MTTTSRIEQYNRAAREKLLRLLQEKKRRLPVWWPFKGPQSMASETEADITGYGGAAGGGKTDLVCGNAITKHKRVLVMRREKAQTEGILQRLSEIIGSNSGYNSQKSIWRIPVGNQPIIEFGGLDNPGDEKRWQGRPHDLKAFDEVTEMREYQVRFCMAWLRSNDPDIHCRIIMTFNPPTTADGRWVIDFFAPWLDPKHPNPAMPGELRYFAMVAGEETEVPDKRPFVLQNGNIAYDFDPAKYEPEKIIKPKSRTFIPARVTDNPVYMQGDYMSTLQGLPEPLRSQMLYGDFTAGMKDDAFQVIPTAWVDAAMARWKLPDKKPPMDSLGVDVARGGADKTMIARRHGMWFDELLDYPGKDTPDGPTVAGLAISAMRDRAPIHIDVIGVGSSPYDYLRNANQQVVGVCVSEAATGYDKSGVLKFFNQRSQHWWMMREALDPANNTGICLPPDKELARDLCTPTWKLSGKTIQVQSREEIFAKIKRSPDRASAVLLALIDTPKIGEFTGALNDPQADYNPYRKP